MRFTLRRAHAPLAVLMLQAALVGMAWWVGGQASWLAALVIAIILGAWAWLDTLGRARAIRDTPTSRVASAAQGFVELIGSAQPLSDTQLLSPMTHLPCLWYRFQAYRRVNDRWLPAEAGESDLEFVLDDGSGRCTVDPRGADILSHHKETREVGDRRYTEYLLLREDRLYVIGQFRSWHPAQQTRDRQAEVGQVLSDWKNDQPGLHERFDLDRNGRIDDSEWRLARQAAGRQADQAHKARQLLPISHALCKPPGRRLYLISNFPPEDLGRRYARWSTVHLLVMLALITGLGWAVRLQV